jgi:uncharacterized protein
MIHHFKGKLPSLKTLKNRKSLRKIKHRLEQQELFHFNRHAVAGGIAIGLFINFLPLPFQMFWAALLAILCSVNLPIAVALTWINNPFTAIAINYFMYKVGSMILSHPSQINSYPTFSWEQEAFNEFIKDLMIWIVSLGKPYIVGVLVVSLGAALLGYSLTYLLWGLLSIDTRKDINRSSSSRDKKKKRTKNVP